MFEAATISTAAFCSANVSLHDEVSHSFGGLAVGHVEQHLVIALCAHRVGKQRVVRYTHAGLVKDFQFISPSFV